MTFVSVVGNEKYINICTDGLAVYNNGTKDESYQKFVILDDSHFVAFAGTIQAALSTVDVARELLKEDSGINYDSWLRELVGFVKSIPYEDGHKSIICCGGKDLGVLRFSSFSNKPGEVLTDFKLTDRSPRFVFLSNYADPTNQLDQKLADLVIKYADKSFKARDIMLAQKDLNDYVSDHSPNEVNKNKQTYTFK